MFTLVGAVGLLAALAGSQNTCRADDSCCGEPSFCARVRHFIGPDGPRWCTHGVCDCQIEMLGCGPLNRVYGVAYPQPTPDWGRVADTRPPCEGPCPCNHDGSNRNNQHDVTVTPAPPYADVVPAGPAAEPVAGRVTPVPAPTPVPVQGTVESR
jgi:hypothetical protein